ncbi:polysaccharide deacetylase family protein [Lichenifustis flavocetrariae]|uniref:Chitooligosaccharide deacetylase n=1 Tax=Lichenifustis flavocetrariae TaxID=2949735 RepID=A0AA41YX23_9HYPH|nr:polysaccharide deacetylase family protein [Lichenifustis flavocetrariae]MCW6510169.1 polysaccharide deacetylase family protein [Lichenifustis flavocetrariae]
MNAFQPFVGTAVPGPERDLVGYGRHAPRVPLPNGGRVAISIVVNYEEGSEYAHPNGDGRNDGMTESIYAMDPRYRDLCAESVYEYGSRAGIWRLERLFSAYQIPVTFFAAAVALERNREVAAWIREAGHEPCSHGWRWEEVWTLSRDEEAEHIRRAVASITETCGQRPLGWYCRYGASVHTRELLLEEGGFEYDSDAYNDDFPYYARVGTARQLIVPYSATYNDARFSLVPSYGSPSDYVDNLKRGFDLLHEEGADHPRLMSIGLHPRIIGQASRVHALREFLDYARAKGGAEFMRRIDIARWWKAAHPAD